MSEAFCAAEGYGVALFDIDGEMPFDGRHGSMKPEGRDIYRSRTIRAVSKPLQLVRSRTDEPSLA